MKIQHFGSSKKLPKLNIPRRLTISFFKQKSIKQSKLLPLYFAQDNDIAIFEHNKNSRIQEKYPNVDTLNTEFVFHLIKDETNFIKLLKKFIEDFIEKLESKEVISKNIQSLLFENIKELYENQTKFIQKLHLEAKKRLPNMIYLCFQDFNFIPFKRYIQKFEVILYLFEDLCKTDEHFSQICKDLEKEMREKLNLLLFCPFQRIDQYYLTIYKFLSNLDPKSDIYSISYPIFQEILEISEEPNFHPYLYLFEHQNELGYIQHQIEGFERF
ncbi:protein vav [Anaeramoeba ignava]|uniref:Protein vav n=1 Tax=Anaeramoeba ignava TaxID=1746090 RepID=A0A9Q0LFT0_ANAIG|nr:protein vav [Anaeramoeba ignava]